MKSLDGHLDGLLVVVVVSESQLKVMILSLTDVPFYRLGKGCLKSGPLSLAIYLCGRFRSEFPFLELLHTATLYFHWTLVSATQFAPSLSFPASNVSGQMSCLFCLIQD